MKHTQQLERLVSAGKAPLAEWPDRYPNYQAMGYLCSYVPEEIIHAAGYVPVRLRGNSAPLRHADAHLQSFTCSLCRSTLDQALGGALGHLAGTVFAHTCDAMQALADLWHPRTQPGYFLDVVMQPSNLGSPAARRYLVAELERFRSHLAAFSGRPVSDDELRHSIALYDETRRLVHRLQDKRHRFGSPEFFSILDAAQKMPREEFNPALSELLVALEVGGDPESEPPPGAPRPPALRTAGVGLYLVGAVLDESRLLELVDALGARVVGDDLCSGSRHFAGQVGLDQHPLSALADYYLARTPCPTKLQPGHHPGDALLANCRAAKAAGVISLLEKFCDPFAFDYALALPTLERAGLPHLLLEMEHTPSLEALRTRLQAFVEML